MDNYKQLSELEKYLAGLYRDTQIAKNLAVICREQFIDFGEKGLKDFIHVNETSLTTRQIGRILGLTKIEVHKALDEAGRPFEVIPGGTLFEAAVVSQPYHGARSVIYQGSSIMAHFIAAACNSYEWDPETVTVSKLAPATAV